MRAFSFIVHFIGELGGHKTLPTLKNKNHKKIKLRFAIVKPKNVSFKEAVKLTVKVSNGNVENKRRKIRIWFIYVFSLSIKKVTMRRKKKKSRKCDGETQLGFASTGDSYYLEFSNLKMLSVLLDSKNDDFQTKFQLSLSESWWTLSVSWFSALVRGGGGIGETNLLRKAKTTTTTTKKKLLDVGAKSFAVLEWYSYYGKKSVLDSMINHKTGVAYHLLRPPGWTSWA